MNKKTKHNRLKKCLVLRAIGGSDITAMELCFMLDMILLFTFLISPYNRSTELYGLNQQSCCHVSIILTIKAIQGWSYSISLLTTADDKHSITSFFMSFTDGLIP